MNQNIASAIFDTRPEAEAAVGSLRASGVSNSDISIIAQSGGTNTTSDGADVVSDDDDHGWLKGLLGGAGLGAVAGIAALAIPGVGPLVAAGAIAQSAIGGAAVTGAAIGAATGGLAGALTDHGVSDDDARYYEERVNNGGVFVSVDTSRSSVNSGAVLDILHQHGGHNSTRTKL